MKSKSKRSNLVTRWRYLKKTRDAESLADALRDVNARLGRSYLHHHITRMESGERVPDAIFHNLMLRYVLAIELGDLGLSEIQIEGIYRSTMLPINDRV